MNDTPAGRQIHTAKSNWIYIIVGEVKEFNKEAVIQTLSCIEGLQQEEIFLHIIPIPLLAPTSQVQAAMWSSQFWPTVYRKNNPLGPHPSMVGRGTDELKNDALPTAWPSTPRELASAKPWERSLSFAMTRDPTSLGLLGTRAGIRSTVWAPP